MLFPNCAERLISWNQVALPAGQELGTMFKMLIPHFFFIVLCSAFLIPGDGTADDLHLHDDIFDHNVQDRFVIQTTNGPIQGFTSLLPTGDSVDVFLGVSTTEHKTAYWHRFKLSIFRSLTPNHLWAICVSRNPSRCISKKKRSRRTLCPTAASRNCTQRSPDFEGRKCGIPTRPSPRIAST